MRYQVQDGSKLGHCCIDATVIDTEHTPPKGVCECLCYEDAQKIAAALNALPEPPK